MALAIPNRIEERFRVQRTLSHGRKATALRARSRVYAWFGWPANLHMAVRKGTAFVHDLMFLIPKMDVERAVTESDGTICTLVRRIAVCAEAAEPHRGSSRQVYWNGAPLVCSFHTTADRIKCPSIYGVEHIRCWCSMALRACGGGEAARRRRNATSPCRCTSYSSIELHKAADGARLSPSCLSGPPRACDGCEKAPTRRCKIGLLK